MGSIDSMKSCKHVYHGNGIIRSKFYNHHYRYVFRGEIIGLDRWGAVIGTSSVVNIKRELHNRWKNIYRVDYLSSACQNPWDRGE